MRRYQQRHHSLDPAASPIACKLERTFPHCTTESDLTGEAELSDLEWTSIHGSNPSSPQANGGVNMPVVASHTNGLAKIIEESLDLHEAYSASAIRNSSAETGASNEDHVTSFDHLEYFNPEENMEVDSCLLPQDFTPYHFYETYVSDPAAAMPCGLNTDVQATTIEGTFSHSFEMEMTDGEGSSKPPPTTRSTDAWDHTRNNEYTRDATNADEVAAGGWSFSIPEMDTSGSFDPDPFLIDCKSTSIQEAIRT